MIAPYYRDDYCTLYNCDWRELPVEMHKEKQRVAIWRTPDGKTIGSHEVVYKQGG